MTHPAVPCVLILGGTGEARRLAAALGARPDLRVVSTLAGRVRAPRLPAGEVRVGGFGGPAGLAGWLRAERVSAIVDATHPFAERITASAAEAAEATGIPILRLRRPGWVARPGDDWRWVDSLAAAAALLPDTGRRAFLTTGRQGLAAFAGLDAVWFLIRCVDEPGPPLPKRRLLLLGRGPYTVDGELGLLRAHRIDLLVSKDSGGEQTVAKLGAARELGLPVIMVRRPPEPDLPAVPTAGAVLRWLDTVVR
ncbi:MAG: cobalt-precorrin-6A reductase [Labedaea sp.]